ncbi:hypothetical protein MCAMS1_02174 [biofilm metagenome]
MPSKTIPLFILIALIALGYSTKTFAGTYSSIFTKNLASGFNFSTGDSWINAIQIKQNEPYDEKKDPALRKGTENEEMPQGSFFAVPGFIIGIALVFLFFNREK